MTRLLTKICGMTDPHNILEIAGLSPDYLGFIFFERSPRQLKLSNLASEVVIPAAIKKVGVFVNESLSVVLRQVQLHQLDAVQLHGDESEIYCNELQKALPNLEIIKAFRVSTDFDFKLLKTYRSINFFLFDTYKAGQAGGTGQTFDWNLLHTYQEATPYFLSGGIGLDKIPAVKSLSERDARLSGVDFNSALESSVGIKNISLCREVLGKINE